MQKQPCTKRGLLSMINQTYDPLGVLQPYLLPARKLLQEACAEGLSWDEPMPSSGWDKWLSKLPLLESLALERCFKLPGKPVKSSELHVFADASTQGYGICAYIRVCYDDDFVTCFVCGKSRVTPLRPVTIPRLELTAAELATKLGSVVCKELQYSFERVVFWSDASVRLRYINSESSHFKMFVSNRLETIHTMSFAQQWRYVPTDLNPADIASRGLTPDNIDAAKSWLHGPEFLLEDERQWPE